MPLKGNELKSLAKIVLIPLGLTAAASAADSKIHKKIVGYGITALIILNEEMNDIMKIDNPLEESGLLIKSVKKQLKMKQKKKKSRIISMLLGILGASLLRYLLIGKAVMRSGEGSVRTS